jgi:hypothetical protein
MKRLASSQSVWQLTVGRYSNITASGSKDPGAMILMDMTGPPGRNTNALSSARADSSELKESNDCRWTLSPTDTSSTVTLEGRLEAV